MSTRDDFSMAVKRQLAERAGYRCSYLGCGKPTIGPSDERPDATSSIGVAAHIAAAAPGKGARRYLADMTSEERSGLDNGIWMCQDHGKIVDTDETRFSIAVLKKWRLVAEAVAKIMMERNWTYERALEASEFGGFTADAVSIDRSQNENEIIGHALHDAGVLASWGQTVTAAIRDFLIEHLRNAFIHGKATHVEFEIADNYLALTDNGSPYNPKSMLLEEGKGGKTALVELMEKFGTSIAITTQRIGDKNVTKVAMLTQLNEIAALTPCSYELTHHDLRKSQPSLDINQDCDEVFIVLPPYTCPSDVGMMHRQLLTLSAEKRPVTFIAVHLSESVKDTIRHFVPEAQLIELSHPKVKR